MERVYYTINETIAKTAKEMMSFDDYVMGSTTAAYKSSVDNVYDLAEKAIEAKPKEADRIEALAHKYSKNLAKYYNEDARIGCMCPSIMISGGSNFPVKEKEKQNAAWEKNMEYLQHAEETRNRIKKIMYGRDIIKSNDADAIEKLRDKIKGLENSQQMMKDINAYYRKHKTLEGCDILPSDQMAKVAQSMALSWRENPKPFESYALTNNNANIRRCKERLQELEDVKNQESVETETEYCKIIENTECMRLQLIFEDKPSEEVRAVLKSHGFRWAPSQGVWQRQLNNNARYAVKQVMAKFEAM